MKIKSFDDLFVCLLSDIYVLEGLIIKNMPNLIKKAQSNELKDALKTHFGETKEQVRRLENIFQKIKQQPLEVSWAGDITNLFIDAETFLHENETSPLLDAAIIAFAQRIEHFEIATYGTLKEFAEVLGHDEVKSILKETLKEEAHADKLLSKIAEGTLISHGVNVKATR
jgi:ferritin-like metal-binding protein YciE